MDKALDYWTKVMGVGPFFLERHITGNNEEYIYKGKRCVQDVIVAHAYTGDLDIELICPNILHPSPIVDFLQSHPEGGAQHLGVLIEDWDATLKRPEVQQHWSSKDMPGTFASLSWTATPWARPPWSSSKPVTRSRESSAA